MYNIAAIRGVWKRFSALKLFLNILCLTSIVFLYGCATNNNQIEHYQYTSPESDSGRECLVQCEQSKSLCFNSCAIDKNCAVKIKEMGEIKFALYVDKQNEMGKKVERDKNSFYDLSRCISGDCSCTKEYNSCYEMCGGSVSSSKW